MSGVMAHKELVFFGCTEWGFGAIGTTLVVGMSGLQWGLYQIGHENFYIILLVNGGFTSILTVNGGFFSGIEWGYVLLCNFSLALGLGLGMGNHQGINDAEAFLSRSGAK
jgi:hypothetical protein